MREIIFEIIDYKDSIFNYAYDAKGQYYDSGDINALLDSGYNVYYLKNDKKIKINNYEDIKYKHNY